jgi:hypothetical protein
LTFKVALQKRRGYQGLEYQDEKRKQITRFPGPSCVVNLYAYTGACGSGTVEFEGAVEEEEEEEKGLCHRKYSTCGGWEIGRLIAFQYI